MHFPRGVYDRLKWWKGMKVNNLCTVNKRKQVFLNCHTCNVNHLKELFSFFFLKRWSQVVGSTVNSTKEGILKLETV